MLENAVRIKYGEIESESRRPIRIYHCNSKHCQKKNEQEGRKADLLRWLKHSSTGSGNEPMDEG